MVLLIFILFVLHGIADSQILLKRYQFPGEVWPSFIYKKIEFKVENLLACSSLCNVEKSSCNGIMFEAKTSFCGLANMTGNYSALQNNDCPIYIVQGRNYCYLFIIKWLSYIEGSAPFRR